MATIPHHPLFVGVLAVALATSASVRPAPAQQRADTLPVAATRLQGEVYDSTRATGLAGATVFVFGTQRSAVTDDDGRFLFEGLAPGEYSLVFFHERLARLGVSAGSSAVTLVEGDTAQAYLAIPSIVTLLTMQCELDDPGGADVRVVGVVLDNRTGIPIPGAVVTMSWQQEGEPFSLEARADAEGWYRICTVPGHVRVAASAELFDRASERRELVLPDGTSVRVDLPLRRLLSGSVHGTVLDFDSGEPIDGALIQLLGTDHERLSNGAGRFRFEDLHPGEYTLSVSHLAHGTRQHAVRVESGMAHALEVPMTAEAIQLDPIEVSVRSEVEERAIAMGGRVIPREDIQRVVQQSRDVGDVLRSQHIPGLFLRRMGDKVCVGFTPGQVQMYKNDCEPAQVYIDNVRATDPEIALSMPPEVVDRIVLFRPVEAGSLFRVGSASGVIMIFTRSGRR